MTELFFFFPHSILGFIGLGGIFLINLSCLTICFVIALFLSIFKRDYSPKKRLWCAVFFLGIIMVQLGFEIVARSVVFLPFIIGASLIYLSVLIALPTKRNEITEEQLSFVRSLSKKIDNGSEKQPIFEELSDVKRNDISTVKVAEEPPISKNEELDFSHVRGVINRLDYYALSQNDKRQVLELESALNFAERGEYTAEIKSKINDGLGALLKIMSKHGI